MAIHGSQNSASEWKPDSPFRTKWKNTGRVKRDSKGERFRNSRGSNVSFIRSSSSRAGRHESLVCVGPNWPGQARHALRESTQAWRSLHTIDRILRDHPTLLSLSIQLK